MSSGSPRGGRTGAKPSPASSTSTSSPSSSSSTSSPKANPTPGGGGGPRTTTTTTPASRPSPSSGSPSSSSSSSSSTSTFPRGTRLGSLATPISNRDPSRLTSFRHSPGIVGGPSSSSSGSSSSGGPRTAGPKNIKTESDVRRQRPKAFPRAKPKVSFGGAGVPPAAVRPTASPFAQGPPQKGARGLTVAAAAGQKKSRKDRMTAMEDIDPLNKFRPTSLPFVDPLEKHRKQQLKKEKEKAEQREKEKLLIKKEEPENEDVAVIDMEDGKGKEKEEAVLAAAAVKPEKRKKKGKDQEAKESFDEKIGRMCNEEENRKRRVADWFLSEESEDELFFMQLPSSLPSAICQPATTTPGLGKRDPSGVQMEFFQPNLGVIPDGHVGKLLIYKSGKAKLQLGDVLFDLVPGTECAFLQEVAVVSPATNRCCVLGDLSRRLICSPDIDALLAPRLAASIKNSLSSEPGPTSGSPSSFSRSPKAAGDPATVTETLPSSTELVST